VGVGRFAFADLLLVAGDEGDDGPLTDTRFHLDAAEDAYPLPVVAGLQKRLEQALGLARAVEDADLAEPLVAVARQEYDHLRRHGGTPSDRRALAG
jgi:hypothetical protein